MSFEALKETLRGVAFTTTTPFSEDGDDVLYDELKRNARAIDEAGGDLFIPCGNSGEYYALTDEERVNVVEATIDAVGDGNAIVAGVGGSTKTAISLATQYQEAGVDAIMIMHPSHTYLHERGLLEYYRRIVEAVDCGIVLYKRGPELTEDIIAELSTEDNVVAVKYAVNDIKGFSRAVENVPGDLVWSNGIAERFAPAFALEGAEGFTTGIGNFVPKATLALMDALSDEDWESARQIREALRPYEDLREETGPNNAFSAANNVPAVKYGMELAGLYGGPVREPLIELSDADKQRAEQYYEAIQEAVIETEAIAD
ncbi:dihydrodipicolinate synthase family protein [Halomicrococcus sp. NG-SE-24]|uniref:dihydrodipicolinate synthase family protein n=1 Tax=Halomicrococcus sp. NG-SE-24 TaxID=3436928 RepID=UPI003D9936E5